MRSYRGLWLWLWLGGLFLALTSFLTAIAIAYFIKEDHYALFWDPWMVAGCVSLVTAFTCFFAAIKAWPFLPLTKPRFPDIKVEIYGAGSTDTEREAGTGLDVPAHLRSFNTRFINAEAEKDASLTVRLYVRLTPGSWGRAGEFVCPPPSWTLPPSTGLNPVKMPLALSPGDAIDGQLIYEIPIYYLDKIADPPDARLEIEDHISGRRMNIRAEMGHYDRTNMVRAAGGIEILGPEYESQQQHHDVVHAPPEGSQH